MKLMLFKNGLELCLDNRRETNDTLSSDSYLLQLRMLWISLVFKFLSKTYHDIYVLLTFTKLTRHD